MISAQSPIARTKVVLVVHPIVFVLDIVGSTLLGDVGRNVMRALACIEEEIPEHTPLTMTTRGPDKCA